MRPRSQANPIPTWPESPFDRLDLESYLYTGTDRPESTSLAAVEALWRARGAELDPDAAWWAWREWGEPGGGR